jgi:mannose-6-phosphate isomerase-like protein (cupin superfamily)
VLPPGYASGRHMHERQEELYFVHRGAIQFTFNDGETQLLEAGGLARVDPATVRSLRNMSGSDDAVYLCVGGAGGYVGRDGLLPEGESSPR